MRYQVLPDLTPIEYEALKADICERGVLVPVEVDENGDLLDGHHRVKAWQELTADGVDLPDYPRIVRTGLTEEQKRNHARSLNVLRRQLGREQRDAVMVAMRQDGMTYQAIAKAVGVSVFTAHKTASDVELLDNKKLLGADGKYRPSSYASPATNGNHFEAMTPLIDYEAEPEAYDEEDEPEDDGIRVFSIEDESGHVETWSVGPDQQIDIIKKPDAMAVHYESNSPEHYTPQDILDRAIACMGGIDLDPCSNSHETPNVPAATHYTAADDGLAQDWQGTVFLNPPYGREIDGWIAKLVDGYERGNVTEAIALVPARTDTQWWQRFNDYHICFVVGRLTFIGNDGPAPFPSAIVYLGSETDAFVNTFEDLGPIWHRTRRGYCYGE